MMDEEWRDIPYLNDYQCSSLGRFRSKSRRVRFVTKSGGVAYRNKIGKLLVQSLNRNRGYLYVTLGAGIKKSSHRFLATTFLDNYSDELDVDHINGNRIDNRVSNIRMATRKQNINNPYTKQYCLNRKRNSNGTFI
jgi:hypothetical protein